MAGEVRSHADHVSISLLHPTFRAGERALDVRRNWLERAAVPSRVEHVFSLDEDDAVSLAATNGLNRVVNPAAPGVTAVRNWNAAAKAASGDLLFAIADDLTPPAGWDVTLDRTIGRLDPRRMSFAVRVADIEPSTDSRPWLMRQPVVSRRYYEELGLFDGEYTGLFCDDDITLRSFWHAVVLDGTSLVLRHRHDTDNPTASQEQINTDAELARGRMLRDRRWGSFRPPTRAAFFPVPAARFLVGPMALLWRWQIRARARVMPARRLLRRISVASAIRASRARAWLEGVASRD